MLQYFENIMIRLRYVSLIAVIASGLGSVLMFIIGAIKVFGAYNAYFGADYLDTTLPNEAANIAITFLIQAVDTFLIGLVFMIFSGGIYFLYIRHIDTEKPEVSSWIRIQNISQLKNILAELVIIILFVKFLEGALKFSLNDLKWEMLVLPAGIMMLAIALKLLALNKPRD
ncbi:MAG: YqhA family protein [Gammaproteobacteria bacterium]|nr:YqhA family protein [Gammaproteobacteria bacterium]